MAQDPRPGNILDSEPFAYRYGKSWEEIRNVGRKSGIRFIGVQEEMGDFIKRPILGNRNTFTEKLRSAQYRSILGFNFVSKQRAAGKKYSGLTVSLTGAGGYGSELDLNIVDSQFADVGVSKRGIVDYLSKYEKHDLFSWAKQNTIGYSNWNDVFGNAASIARWESKYGQLAKDAVFKLNESAGGEGVWFGLDKVPSNLRGNKNLLVQPKIDILEEFRVVHAGGEAVDISYRWGSPGVRDFVEKTGLSRVLKFAGIKSGKPELLQPVTGRMAERLKKFSETYARTLPYGVGALDIAQTREGFKVIEAQKKFGNFSLPWVRGKIEYALTGRIPLEAKIGGGLAAAAVGGVIAWHMLNKKHDRKGSNDEAPNKIVGHHPGWADTKTSIAISSDFSAGSSYDPKPDSPGYSALNLAKQSGIPVLSIKEFIKPKIKDKREIYRGLEYWELTHGATYSTGDKKHRYPFIVVPERYLEGKSAWDEYAVMAHELGHSEMYGGIPKPVIGAVSKFGGTGIGTAGASLAIFGALAGSEELGESLTHAPMFRKVSKIGLGMTITGSLTMLASETWANIYASRKLKEVDAPREAYNTIKGSEKSYIGSALEMSGAAVAAQAYLYRNRKLGYAALSAFVIGGAINASGINQFRRSKQRMQNTVGLVQQGDRDKIGSKAGTASTKARKFLRKQFKDMSN